MQRLATILSIAIVTMTIGASSMAAFAQTDPNTPTGPNNPNPPSQLTGSLAATPCGVGATIASNAVPAKPPAAAAGQPQAAQTGTPDNKPSANAGCAAPDHPAGATTPAPGAAPHP